MTMMEGKSVANEKFRELFPMISRRNRDIELKSNNVGSFCQRAAHDRASVVIADKNTSLTIS